VDVTLSPASVQAIQTNGYGDFPELLTGHIAAALAAYYQRGIIWNLRDGEVVDPKRLDALNGLRLELTAGEYLPYRILNGRLCWGSRMQDGHVEWWSVGDCVPIMSDVPGCISTSPSVAS